MKETPGQFGKQLGFRARDEHVFIDGDFEAAKGSRPDDVLQGFAGAAPADEFANGADFVRGELAIEVEVEIHARHFEKVREKEFGLQTRRVDALAAEELGAALNDFENGHRRKLRANESGPKRKEFGGVDKRMRAVSMDGYRKARSSIG